MGRTGDGRVVGTDRGAPMLRLLLPFLVGLLIARSGAPSGRHGWMAGRAPCSDHVGPSKRKYRVRAACHQGALGLHVPGPVPGSCGEGLACRCGRLMIPPGADREHAGHARTHGPGAAMRSPVVGGRMRRCWPIVMATRLWLPESTFGSPWLRRTVPGPGSGQASRLDRTRPGTHGQGPGPGRFDLRSWPHPGVSTERPS